MQLDAVENSYEVLNKKEVGKSYHTRADVNVDRVIGGVQDKVYKSSFPPHPQVEA